MGWSEIPEDIFLAIAEHLPTIIDYLNVSQVCKPWRSSALSPLNLAIPSQPPFLMLAESEGEENTSQCLRGFVVYSSNNQGNKVYNLSLPEIHHMRCMGSTGNWLILINMELDIFMFNPFSKSKLHFPSQSTLPEQFNDEQYGSGGDDDDDKEMFYTQEEMRNFFIQKVFLSSSNSKDVVAMAIFSGRRGLAIARPGDLSWTPVEIEINTFPNPVNAVEDAIFFKGQFYSVNRRGNVAACDISSNPPKAIKIVGDFKDLCAVGKYYLVEWLGNLLLVARYFTSYETHPFYETNRFEVYIFDFNNNEWEEVESLGEHSLFLGFNTSVSLLISEYSPFQRNCVYFTDNNSIAFFGDDMEGGHDMGVFDLNDKTIKPHYDELSTSFHSPPLWIIPQSIC
ncbi:hypothetical protein ACHQM5_021524 [Ranunculus cassubicifolius]